MNLGGLRTVLSTLSCAYESSSQNIKSGTILRAGLHSSSIPVGSGYNDCSMGRAGITVTINSQETPQRLKKPAEPKARRGKAGDGGDLVRVRWPGGGSRQSKIGMVPLPPFAPPHTRPIAPIIQDSRESSAMEGIDIPLSSCFKPKPIGAEKWLRLGSKSARLGAEPATTLDERKRFKG